MIIEPIGKPQPTFGIKVGNTKVSRYAPHSYLTEDFGRYKDYKFHITKNYVDDKLKCSLCYVTDKAGKWITSKLKYVENGVRKVIWSKNNV